MLKEYFHIFWLLIFTQVNAQVDFSASNLLRYGSGERSIGSLKNNFMYRENLTDLRIRLPEKITFGARLLYDSPPETGKSFKGISRRFVEYKGDYLELRLGNMSELFGKGLALNLFENRGIAYDTWLDGLKAKYSFGNFKTTLLYGKVNFLDSTSFYRTEDYTLLGGNTEYKFSKTVSLGFSFVNAKGKIGRPQITDELKAEIGEFYFSVKSGNLGWLFDFSHKWTGVENSESSKGYGIYSVLNYTANGLGLTIDYKNYRYDERDPFERNDFTRATRMLPFQNPPTVMKEHSYLFLSRSIHEIDFNDEVGVQLEVFYSINEDTHLNFNGSFASRHDFYNYNQNNFSFKKEARPTNYIPSLDDKYSPFKEMIIEVEHTLNKSATLTFGIAGRSKVTYNDFTGDNGTHKIRSTVIPFLLQQSISEDYSATIQYEYESVFDNFNSSQNEFSNHFVSLIGNIYSKVILGFRYEFTTNTNEVSGKKDWFTIEGGYRIAGAHNISISYGRERGGQTCSNGVCRYIQPFDGIRITLLSNF
jgi:hypothetical protein